MALSGVDSGIQKIIVDIDSILNVTITDSLEKHENGKFVKTPTLPLNSYKRLREMAGALIKKQTGPDCAQKIQSFRSTINYLGSIAQFSGLPLQLADEMLATVLFRIRYETGISVFTGHSLVGYNRVHGRHDYQSRQPITLRNLATATDKKHNFNETTSRRAYRHWLDVDPIWFDNGSSKKATLKRAEYGVNQVSIKRAVELHQQYIGGLQLHWFTFDETEKLHRHLRGITEQCTKRRYLKDGKPKQNWTILTTTGEDSLGWFLI